MGEEQVQSLDALTETSLPVVVLAVDVAGDGPPHADELGAGDYRQKPTPGQEGLQEIRQGDAGLTGDHAGLGVEIQDLVETPGIEHPVVEGAVAITSSHGVDDEVAGSRQTAAQLGQAAKGLRLAVNHRVSPPSAELHAVKRPLPALPAKKCNRKKERSQRMMVIWRKASLRRILVGEPERFSTRVI